MIIQLDKRFQKHAEGIFGRYQFQVGVLEDGPHMAPRRGKRGQGGKDVISTYAGGPVRKKSRKPGPLTIAEVSEANRVRLGVNYLTKPFEKRDSAIMKLAREFFALAFGRSEPRRLTNMLQAIVRNPILRGEYGSNSALTKKIKGFDRYMIDTGQLFKSIKAKVLVKGGKRV